MAFTWMIISGRGGRGRRPSALSDRARAGLRPGRTPDTGQFHRARVGPVSDSFDQQCVGTLVLPDGDITFQGLISVTAAGPGDINVAITGGTGRYRTAHGFIHAVITNTTDTNLTVHLIL
ncbi:hypothetical protein SSOG_01700 [Streptomyces himastatinicus ATCC 53653]|uniref:Allene oxide cyclase barrel-like domain-containing protein n=1 Tax=Streptomyces himastatinicus ATCC 53653 TaxID=457427 RepID=D9WR11_9ACTN|nr:hypothetical protein SSOG_01700 [Streptomyces himastatinicus ATCC 53653]